MFLNIKTKTKKFLQHKAFLSTDIVWGHNSHIIKQEDVHTEAEDASQHTHIWSTLS